MTLRSAVTLHNVLTSAKSNWTNCSLHHTRLYLVAHSESLHGNETVGPSADQQRIGDNRVTLWHCGVRRGRWKAVYGHNRMSRHPPYHSGCFTIAGCLNPTHELHGIFVVFDVRRAVWQQAMTHYWDQTPFWETDGRFAGLEVSCMLCYQRFSLVRLEAFMAASVMLVLSWVLAPWDFVCRCHT